MNLTKQVKVFAIQLRYPAVFRTGMVLVKQKHPHGFLN